MTTFQLELFSTELYPILNKYIVNVREVWVQGIEIEALNEKDAIEAISKGKGVVLEDLFEYSHCLDEKFWTIEPV